jgi:hypothetical protein
MTTLGKNHNRKFGKCERKNPGQDLVLKTGEMTG